MVGFLYIALGIYILGKLLYTLFKNQRLDYISLFDIYFVGYYIIPSVVYAYNPNYRGRYSSYLQFDSTYTAVIMVYLAYMFVVIGYRCVFRFRETTHQINIKKPKVSRYIPNEKQFFWYVIMGLWLVGGLSLIAYCSMYGGVIRTLMNSALIRDRVIESSGSSAIEFISRFVICLMYAAFFMYVKYLKREVGVWWLVSSVVLAALYLIIHAGRGAILTFILTMLMIRISLKKEKIKISKLLVMGIIVLVGVYFLRPLLVSMQSLKDGFSVFCSDFVRRITNDGASSVSFTDLLNNLCRYLEHKYVSLEVAIRSIRQGTYNFNCFRDVFVALISVVPSALLPFDKPSSIDKENTLLVLGSAYEGNGVIPPGGVAFGYYALGAAGVTIFALAIGIIGRRIQKYYNSFDSDYFVMLENVCMFIWVDWFINGELRECVLRYFVFIFLSICIAVSARRKKCDGILER